MHMCIYAVVCCRASQYSSLRLYKSGFAYFFVIYLNTRFSAFMQRFTCGQSVEKGERFVPAAVCSRSSSVSAHGTASCDLVSRSPSCVLVSRSPSCVLVSRGPSCVLVSRSPSCVLVSRSPSCVLVSRSPSCVLGFNESQPDRPGMNYPTLLDTSQLDLGLVQSA